jgi:hypothetical protein
VLSEHNTGSPVKSGYNRGGCLQFLRVGGGVEYMITTDVPSKSTPLVASNFVPLW